MKRNIILMHTISNSGNGMGIENNQFSKLFSVHCDYIVSFPSCVSEFEFKILSGSIEFNL